MKIHVNKTIIMEIKRQVAAIAPFDEMEQAHQADAVHWLASGINPFRITKPDIPPKHLVSYFVLVDPGHESLLLVDHIKAQLWLPTGGHVKLNEHPRDAVTREAQEELNLKTTFLYQKDAPFFITINKTVGLTPGHTDASLWYLLRGSVYDTLTYDKKRSEFHDTEWFSFQEILATDPVIFDPHLQRFTRKLQTYL